MDRKHLRSAVQAEMRIRLEYAETERDKLQSDVEFKVVERDLWHELDVADETNPLDKAIDDLNGKIEYLNAKIQHLEQAIQYVDRVTALEAK